MIKAAFQPQMTFSQYFVNMKRGGGGFPTSEVIELITNHHFLGIWQFFCLGALAHGPRIFVTITISGIFGLLKLLKVALKLTVLNGSVSMFEICKYTLR